MRKNMSKVIQAFRAGVAAKGDSKGTCSTDGRFVMSYAMVIASRDSEGVNIASPDDAPSVTTRGHIRALLAEFPGATRLLTGRGDPPVPWTPEEKRGPMSGPRI